MAHGAQHSSRKTGLQLCSLFPFQVGRREFPVLRFGTEYRTWFTSSLCSLTEPHMCKLGQWRASLVRKMQKKMGDFFAPLSPHPTPALPVLIGVRNAGAHHAPMTKPEKIAEQTRLATRVSHKHQRHQRLG